MKYPKLWDGASQIGQAFVRIRQMIGAPVSTTYSTEFREDGTLGTVMTKSSFGFHDVYRYGNDTRGYIPFLCSWISRHLFLLDWRQPPIDKKVLGSPNARPSTTLGTGGCAYIGGGMIAGIFLIPGQPTVVRVSSADRPGRVVSQAEWREASPAQRRSLAVELPITSVPNIFGEPSAAPGAYIQPLGWDAEDGGYSFAVAVTDSVYTPYIEFVSMGSLTVRREWAFSHAVDLTGYKTSNWACTAPGKVEILLLNDDSPTYTYERRSAFSVSGVWYYSGDFVFAPPDPGQSPPAGWPAAGPYQKEFVYVDPFYDAANPTYISLGNTCTFYFTYTFRTASAQAALAGVLSSPDFGRSWSTTLHPELNVLFDDRRSIGAVSEFDVSTVADGTSIWPTPPVPTDAIPVTEQTQSTLTLVHETLNAGMAQESEFYQMELLSPVLESVDLYVELDNNYEFVAAWEDADRVPFPQTPSNLPWRLLPAGETLFAVVWAAQDPVERGAEPLTFPMDRRIRTSGLAEGTASEVVEQTTVPLMVTPYEMRMYRRVGGSGGFSNVPWPGDTAALSLQNTWEVNWTSAGDGCLAVFCIDNGATATTYDDGDIAESPNPYTLERNLFVAATIDGGESWITRRIHRAGTARQVCLIEPDKPQATTDPALGIFGPEEELLADILFVAVLDGRYQMYRMSADLSKLSRYGRPYNRADEVFGRLAPGDELRPGLINFRKYVHPAYPGQYDGPDDQP